MRPPIRLVPEREKLGGILDLAGFTMLFLLVGGFIVRGMIKGPSESLLTRFDGDRAPIIALECLILLVFSGIFIFLLKWLVEAVLATLPGSPYSYTEISSDGIAVRNGLRRAKRFRWAELSSFSIGDQVIRLRGGDKERVPHVIALAGTEAAMPKDKRERYKKAAIRIDAKLYAAGAPNAVNQQLAAWLDALRLQTKAGGPLQDIEVPALFRDSAIAVPVSGSRGVVER